MRIWPREQTDRNRMLFEYHKTHPGESYQDLARQYDLSRQRTYYLIQTQYRKEVMSISK